MFQFIKEMLIGLLSACTRLGFSGSVPSNYKESIKCVSLNNQPCQARPTLVNINCDETPFFSFN